MLRLVPRMDETGSLAVGDEVLAHPSMIRYIQDFGIGTL